MAVLIERAEVSLKEVRRGTGWPHVASAHTIPGIARLLETWLREEGATSELPNLEDASYYCHWVLTALFAHNAAAHGWKVEWARTSSESIPDLYLTPMGSADKWWVEVKAPLILGGYMEVLAIDQVRKGVTAALERANRGAKPQLPRDKPSLTVVGGPFLTPESVRMTKSVAEEWLERVGPRRPNLRAILSMTTGVVEERSPVVQVGNRLQITITTRDIMGYLESKNTSYTGGPQIDFPESRESAEILKPRRSAGPRWPG